MHNVLDLPLPDQDLRAHLGRGQARITGLDCDSRAAQMTPRQAIASILGHLRPLPDLDVVALSKPARIEPTVDLYAAVMILEAIANPQVPDP